MFVSEVTLKNFRCFQDAQKARLAPLTLLMGENSAGKTSFMAILRILMDTVHGEDPDFKKEPYDLGTFEEIIHYQNGKKKEGQPECFEAGFALNDHKQTVNMDLTFGKQETNSVHPSSVKERIFYKEEEGIWLESDLQAKHLKFHTHNGTWESTSIDDKVLGNFKNIKNKNKNPELKKFLTEVLLRRGLFSRPGLLHGPIVSPQMIKWTSKKYSDEDLKQLKRLISIAKKFLSHRRPYASAPVRSKPKKTYDPAPVRRDPEGEGIPMYLAELSSQNPTKWKKLKKQLEDFGKQSGLFDEISIKRFEKTGSSPFQIQVRKFGKTKGPKQNLIDVGYGVSQVLPVVTELLNENSSPSLFLLQQPEVHLHPSAQAALGSLFCQAVEKKTQLLIETHSDHLMDRIRMDVRDKKTKLKPEDVSILFFERKGLSVDIHSIEIDKEGNVLNAPECYRKFFRNETNRSLGI